MKTEVKEIIVRAIDHYEDGISTSNLCAVLEIGESEFEEYFRSSSDLWSSSYRILLDEAVQTTSSLEGLADADLSDRFSTLIFVLLDVFEGNLEYVQATFSSYAAGFTSHFQKDLKSSLSDLLSSDDVPGANSFLFDNQPTLTILSESIVQLIHIWLTDDTQQRDKSTALIDRSIALWSEILTSAIPQRSVELVKYGVNAGYLPIKNLPFIRDWFQDDTAEDGNDSDDADRVYPESV